MGETTGIAWTDSTINVWHGCDKVSAGCKHCYAEVSTPIRVKRAKGLEVWGPNAARDETKGWESSLRAWGHDVVRRANVAPWRVFGQSLSDTFEDRADLDPLRAKFFRMLMGWEQRSLTFQLLTKRPENIRAMVPPSWLTSWPAHVWIGCTVEDQENADRRIPHLLRVPAAVRFLSVEPQIGPVDLCPWLPGSGKGWGAGIQWVIQGGESGSKARPFDLAWARSMRDQCRAAGVAYFLKQLGEDSRTTPDDADAWADSRGIGRWADRVHNSATGGYHSARLPLRDSHGADESEWPADLRGCRAFPSP